MIYLTTAISPLMIKENSLEMMGISEISFERLKKIFKQNETIIFPAIGHENTARILEKILETKRDLFNRLYVKDYFSIELDLENDCILCIIPKFRVNESREFTTEEVMSAGFLDVSL